MFKFFAVLFLGGRPQDQAAAIGHIIVKKMIQQLMFPVSGHIGQFHSIDKIVPKLGRPIECVSAEKVVPPTG